MSRSRGTMRSDLQRKVGAAHARLLKTTRTLTSADSVVMKEAAAVLQRAIKKQLATKASGLRTSLKTRRTYGDPSAPGESPRRLSGALQRGIRSRVVEGERQVRAENFRSKILEFGFVAPAAPAKLITHGARKGQRRAPQAARTMAPRPFMRPGLEAARPEMAKKGASILRDGVRQALAAQAASGAGGFGGN